VQQKSGTSELGVHRVVVRPYDRNIHEIIRLRGYCLFVVCINATSIDCVLSIFHALSFFNTRRVLGCFESLFFVYICNVGPTCKFSNIFE